MRCRDLIDLDDLTLQDWESLISLAQKIRKAPSEYARAAQGSIIATLFFEPSTRTQLSFQTAMLRLGGQVIGFGDPQTSSIAKGETLKDTVKMVNGYADLIVIRHPSEGAAKAASLYSSCPVINAGDGGHLHPTQTLTDLVTLKEEKRLNGLTIGFCGDLKNGRTVHSLVKAMCRYKNRFVLISTKQLSLPEYIKNVIIENGCEFTETESLEKAIPMLDILYMTRIQRERFSSMEEYEKQRDVYVLSQAKMRLAKPSLRVLHPLPRVDEIDQEVDNDPRAIYFDQAKYGVYARMSLILHLLKQDNICCKPADGLMELPEAVCSNQRCITRSEKYLPHLVKYAGGIRRCAFCESIIEL